MEARKKYMMMQELLCAAVLFGVISAAFLTTVHHMHKAEARFVNEQRALLVLDNTIERVAALDGATAENVEKIFEHEYACSMLEGNKAAKPGVEAKGDALVLFFTDGNGHVIARTTVNTTPRENAGGGE
ncbi:MAG: hypothetical protein JW808_07605 [Victivallales bacterium]|nr:hypothetical protein [Victivallales bacterium]